ncbi:probable methylcrotonoyl-CoA carboxylase beta chain, mitochondrial isoform X1 [Orbicella faveolata]|uniref:probable methylcrotonoyl-CoA carboxylase beta chain, mitochondrial isoform X1 n=1 Tax=Orbicella faveolata TaxID=48498 RepID=UPI0009E60D2D|nr:probable methylcrotonoyl-CoA carboxylase beta chain, mitochondrial isoform X1 [Orbicella faveolata]
MSSAFFYGISRLCRVSKRLIGSHFSKIAGVRAASNAINFKAIDGFVDKNSSAFLSRASEKAEILRSFTEFTNVALLGGGEKAIERHTKRNKKLLVRERLAKLLDEGTDFLELSQLAGLDLEYGSVACAGVVSGIGQISGQLCVIVANDATVKGGTIYPIAVKKQLRAQEIAEVNKLPCVFLIDSGGAFLPLQAEIFPETGGRVFYNEAVMSMNGVPTICVVCGSCTAGAAYVPTMADEAVIVDKIGTIFLGGPPLVKAATGEVVSAEDLGGAMMHSSVSGCTDHFEEDEESALETTRTIVATLNTEQSATPSDVQAPLYDSEDLLTLALYDSTQYPIYQILARLVDGSQFQEFKTRFGTALITGFARIYGYLVGIVANNGSLTSEASLKGAHFVELCCQRNIPLIFLQNTLPQAPSNLSVEANACLIKDQAKMMSAVACAQVPKITVIMKGSYGPSSYTMCGRSFDPHFLFTWPTARVAMDTVDDMVSMCCAEQEVDGHEMEEEKRQTLKDKFVKKFEKESRGYYGTARLWDDGIILPQDTRKVLGQSLRAALSSFPRRQAHKFGVFRM